MHSGAAEDMRYPSRRVALALSALVCFGAFVLFLLVWNRSVRPYYFPFSDDIALIANSTRPFHPSWISWFRNGFKNYFDVYTDYFAPYTNFVRPVVNLTFFFDYLAFGARWGMYLLTTYGIVSAIAAVASFIAYYFLKLGWRLTLLAAICTALAPSLANEAFFLPSHGFDLLAGLFVLLGACALMADALIPAWIIFTVAAFTKETALFAPCFAAVVVFIRKEDKPPTRRCLSSAAFLLPIGAWMALYWRDFRGKRGVYVLRSHAYGTNIAGAALAEIKGLLHWPIAAVDKFEYWRSSYALLKVIFALSLTFNVITWLLVLWGLVYLVKIGTRRAASLCAILKTSNRTQPILILVIFCFGGSLTPVVLGLPNRFGGVFYPLFILCLAFAARYCKRRLVRSYSILMIAAIGIAGGGLIYADVVYYLPTFQCLWAMSEDYMNVLSNSKSPRIFIFDDVSGGFAGTESVQRFSGYQGQIVRLNDLLVRNLKCAGNPKISIANNLSGDVILDSAVSTSCMEHDFNGLLLHELSAQHVVFNRRVAGAILRYQLTPHSSANGSALDTSQLHIVMHLVGGGSILLPDLPSRVYKEITISGHVGASD